MRPELSPNDWDSSSILKLNPNFASINFRSSNEIKTSWLNQAFLARSVLQNVSQYSLQIVFYIFFSIRLIIYYLLERCELDKERWPLNISLEQILKVTISLLYLKQEEIFFFFKFFFILTFIYWATVLTKFL